MAHKPETAFLGKTISRIDSRAVNSWTFFFTDGTQAVIEVEAVNGPIGLYGLTCAACSFT